MKTNARENAYRFLKAYSGCEGLTAELDCPYFQEAMKGHKIDAASMDLLPHGNEGTIDEITATTYFKVDGNIDPVYFIFTVNGTVKYTVSKEAVKVLDRYLSEFADFVEKFIRELFGIEETKMTYLDPPPVDISKMKYGEAKKVSEK